LVRDARRKPRKTTSSSAGARTEVTARMDRNRGVAVHKLNVESKLWKPGYHISRHEHTGRLARTHTMCSCAHISASRVETRRLQAVGPTGFDLCSAPAAWLGPRPRPAGGARRRWSPRLWKTPLRRPRPPLPLPLQKQQPPPPPPPPPPPQLPPPPPPPPPPQPLPPPPPPPPHPPPPPPPPLPPPLPLQPTPRLALRRARPCPRLPLTPQPAARAAPPPTL
jgi:hypothetical protein